MLRLWFLITLALLLLLSSLAFAETDWTPEQQAAMDSVDKIIFLGEQAEFTEVSARAEKGELDALYMLGIYYVYGHGVAKDEAKGYALLRQAADEGNADAQNSMGDYSSGQDSDAAHTEALVWWRKAAEQGQDDAQYSIGQCYEQGWLVEQNDSTAVHWFRLAAEQGNIDAQAALSFSYQEGKGVAQDYQEALFWMLLNFPESWDEGYPSIEMIAYHLTEEERASVENRARIWLDARKK